MKNGKSSRGWSRTLGWLAVLAAAAGTTFAARPSGHAGESREGAAVARPALAKSPTRVILTGVPRYDQDYVTKENEKEVLAGCGPVAALMLLAYYDRRFGYDKLIPKAAESVNGMPENVIFDLRKKMHTITVTETKQGLTEPHLFQSGFKSYIKEHYDCDVDSKSTTGLGAVDGIWEKSLELINANKPHIILFDWEGSGKIFPNHYSVVVGYNREDGKRHLVVNAGWGYDFQLVDLDDKKVKPLHIFWIDMKDRADGKQDGHAIGPNPSYPWEKDSKGRLQLVPAIRKHFSSESTSWKASTSTNFLIDGTNIARCEWD